MENARRIASDVKAGTTLAISAQGTVGRTPGLAPFRLAAAAAARVAVLAKTIRGTHALLREVHWLPRRGAVAVTIGAPILPSPDAPDAFAAALALRGGARAPIRSQRGEPDAAWHWETPSASHMTENARCLR